MRHLRIVLDFRNAEFTAQGQSAYGGLARLKYEPGPMVVEWDASWDTRFAPYRTSRWMESPVVGKVRLALGKAEISHTGAMQAVIRE